MDRAAGLARFLMRPCRAVTPEKTPHLGCGRSTRNLPLALSDTAIARANKVKQYQY
jgi:hypothetical protein